MAGAGGVVGLLLALGARAQPDPSAASGGGPARGPRALTQYVHRAWTAEDGLPYPTVWAITQTRDGYLWVGTRGGLSRFDGARFVTFDTRNTPALRSSAVTSLYEAPDRCGRGRSAASPATATVASPSTPPPTGSPTTMSGP